ncbi:class I SAM-dependent methyltransferase [Paenibacillus pini]|uniref:Methyltransferase domain-containing protein n=1 Tax=Paenibacillus pini JCM 16418 TaxID=1236976 RepID=W7YDY1_9BACL|nr:class I SAM-dependent methyltransferase [Paenibacillus pini]GAF06687.1 hypothetical protein JCM16418_659 [Paenibacillus pini JCM 16418]
MDQNEQFEAARQSEADYHQQFYEDNEIFEEGTWMAEPGPVVMEMLERLLLHKDELQVLDLGCGVGRNTIPVAERLKGTLSRVKGVDLLDDAVEMLRNNAKEFGVEHLVEAEAADVENYPIPEDAYDFIIACSCLEHTSSKEAVEQELDTMKAGTKMGGIHCITMSTDVEEFDRDTGDSTPGLIELNQKSEEALAMLDRKYEDWKVLIKNTDAQSIEEVKDERNIDFRCNLITYVAQKIQ